MLVTLKNNRSLSFYQPTSIGQNPALTSAYTGGIGSVALANASMATATTTDSFNNQLNGFLNSLNAERERLAQKVAQGLSRDLSYTGARSDGVSLAWKYEKADVEMGGSGSANWDKGQQSEISSTGKVRGAEGYHQQNVADHPEQQANPDNIKFYEDKQQHLDKGHRGDWKNESNEPMTDKNQMLNDTNTKRVFRNELRGLGIAVAIGAGVGLTIGFAVTLARQGVTPESLKLALIEGAKGGVEAGIMSAASYGVGRTIGELATKAVAGLLENLGVTITDNISKMCGMGVIGGMTIVIFSAYQFIKLMRQSVATREALLQVGKQALFSLLLLAVSIAVQGMWGGPAGIIVSVSIGIILISYAIGTSVHRRHFAETVRVYMIDKCRPVFS
jgi:hypothetical protein